MVANNLKIILVGKKTVKKKTFISGTDKIQLFIKIKLFFKYYLMQTSRKKNVLIKNVSHNGDIYKYNVLMK